MTPRVLGLTGLSCTGKSTAAAILAARGWRVIDVDRVGHAVLDDPDTQKKLTKAFGSGILNPVGRVDRKTLGNRVFADPPSLALLESLVHPRMVADIRATLLADSETRFVLDAALLFPMGLDALCDRVLVLDAARELRLRRAAGRGWTAEDLVRRDLRLRPVFDALRAENRPAVAWIDNNGDETALARALASRLTDAHESV